MEIPKYLHGRDSGQSRAGLKISHSCKLRARPSSASTEQVHLTIKNNRDLGRAPAESLIIATMLLEEEQGDAQRSARKHKAHISKRNGLTRETFYRRNLSLPTDSLKNTFK